jgi:hypothetical protein
MTLGSQAAISPARARDIAGDLHAQVRLGRDASAEKAERRARAAETMGAVLQNFLAFKRGHLKPRSMVEIERHLMHLASHCMGFNWLRLIAARLPPKYPPSQMRKITPPSDDTIATSSQLR